MLSRVLGVLVFAVCFVLVLDRSRAGSDPVATPPTRPAPAADASVAVPERLAGPHAALSGTSAPFGGLPSVGALFTTDASGHSDHHHFCSGGVVDSPGGNVVVTAAHCLVDPTQPGAAPAQVIFVPGYHDGKEPFGEWASQQVLVDPHWASSGDPDYDVAFIRVVNVSKPEARLADLVGAQQIDFAATRPATVGVIGYPADSDQPIACRNTLTAQSATQSEFDCSGFVDGTSGGPMLTGIDPATGRGTLIGVIGGYEEGGDSPDVSYGAYLGQAAKALYLQAQNGNGPAHPSPAP
jgi:V8-like Glu-specific endopeptidase